MKCVVLQNVERAHLGFLLFSPDLGEPSGQCVFMAVPGQSALLGTPASKLLVDRSAVGESSWRVAGRDPLSVIISTRGLNADLFVELGHAGIGQWGVISGSDRQVVGLALLPPSKKPA